MAGNYERSQIVPVATTMTAWVAWIDDDDDLQSAKSLSVESYLVVGMQLDPETGEGNMLVFDGEMVVPLRQVDRLSDGSTLMGVYPGSERPDEIDHKLHFALLRLRSYARAQTAEATS